MEPFDLRLWEGFAPAGGDLSSPAIVRQVVIDSRRIATTNSLFVALPGCKNHGHQFVADAATRGARYALVDHTAELPTLNDVTILRVQNPLESFQEIARRYRQERKATVVAITGSAGKTMLKDLLASLLSRDHVVHASPDSFNSQIGVALSLLGITDQHTVAVIEAGISQVGEMSILRHMILPDHVIITSIGDQHLATLGSRAQIAREKTSLALDLNPINWFLAASQEDVRALAQEHKLPVRWWDADDSTLPIVSSQSVQGSFGYRVAFPDDSCHVGKLPQGARHNLDLLQMGCKAAWLLGVGSSTMSEILTYYHLHSTRTEVWPCSHGLVLINAPSSTDPQSVELSLRRLLEAPPGTPKIFAFGGMRQGVQLHPKDMAIVAQAAVRSGVDEVALYGEVASSTFGESMGPEVCIKRFHSLDETLSSYSKSLQGPAYLLIKGPEKTPLNEVLRPFEEETAANICTVNLTATAHNIETLRHRLPPRTRLMVMVKALAYGTDNVRMAKFLERCGIDILGVSFIDEGLQLKRGGVTQAIFSLNALPHEARKAVQWDIEVGVSDPQLICALSQAAVQLEKKAKIHLHIDTGMGRLGCRPELALDLARHIVNSPGLVLEGLMTHLACAEDPCADAFTAQQYALFESIYQSLQSEGINVPWCHIANSSGVLRHAFPCCNMARVGLAIFGIHSDLRLALSLTSQVSGLNILRQGESVGYGRHYTVQRPTETIAIVPLGYFDGFSRQYSGNGHAIIRGQKARYLGKICMDYLMVDVTDIPEVAIGDEVLIFGHNAQGHYLAPEELASSAGSVAHELIACLGPRIKRLYIYE
jgi:alanine racemase/UDP-N-acetylmuramoyl-tripeptide--D-alanyl-D-alanine ligase